MRHLVILNERQIELIGTNQNYKSKNYLLGHKPAIINSTLMMQNIVCCSCWFFLIFVPGSCLLVAQVPGYAAALLVTAQPSLHICLQIEACNSLRLEVIISQPQSGSQLITLEKSQSDNLLLTWDLFPQESSLFTRFEFCKQKHEENKTISMQFYIYFKSIWEEQIFTFFRTPTSILVDSKT